MNRKWSTALWVMVLLLLSAQGAWAADTFEILVNGQAPGNTVFELAPSEHLNVDVVAEGIWEGCSLQWASGNEKIAIVNLGVIYAQSENGTTTIRVTATATSGATTTRYLYVSVVGKQQTVVTLRATGGATTLAVGDTLQMIGEVTPKSAGLTWSSGSESVASVDQQGLVTAHKAGRAKITATAQDGSGAQDSVTLTVQAQASITGIKLDRSKATLFVGGVTGKYKSTMTLSASVKPATLADSVAWSSSDESVATVSGGRVTAHKSGKATIRVRGGGKTASCVVTVRKLPTKVELPASGTLRVGGKVNLAKQLKMDGTVNRVKWKSANKKIAKVSAKGVVVGVKPGKTRIRVTTINGKTAYCTVHVVRR